MHDWNAVISVKDHGFTRAMNTFSRFGEVVRTEFYNILIIKANDMAGMLDRVSEQMSRDPELMSFLSRLVPVTKTFIFSSGPDFEHKAQDALQEWIPRLIGKGFHVRIHRRGFKGRVNSPAEEKFLDAFIIGSLEKAGGSAHIVFDNPDAIIIIETIGTRAGLSFWTREDMEHYPFLKLD